MPGELSLTKLICTLKPSLDPRTFVFMTLPYKDQQHPLTIPLLDMQMSFREQEGLTIITTLDAAQQSEFEYFYLSKMVTLEAHSSLEAVGFMKAISARLADEGLSSNPVSAYYHDYLFVKEDEAEKAVAILKAMAEEAKAKAGPSSA